MIRRAPLLASAASVLAACVFVPACATAAAPAVRWTDTRESPVETVAQLRYARLPSVLQPIAVHSFFVVYHPDQRRWHRWEVWQNAGSGDDSWGHVRRDLKGPDSGVGGGPPWVGYEWRGEEAERLRRALELRAPFYPHRDTYVPWPGPNCNTFAAWVFRSAGVSADLDPRAVGKDYFDLVNADVSSTRSGVQLDTPLLGLKIGLFDGIEIHPLGLTLGVDTWPPAFKTPFGRFGLPERPELAEGPSEPANFSRNSPPPTGVEVAGEDGPWID